MPRVPDASDITRKKKLEIITASNKYLDPLKFRTALPSISFFNRFSILSVPPNFLFPTKVLPGGGASGGGGGGSGPYTVPFTVNSNVDFSVTTADYGGKNNNITKGTATGDDLTQYVINITGGTGYTAITDINVVFDNLADISQATIESNVGGSFGPGGTNSFGFGNLAGIISGPPIIITISGVFTITSVTSISILNT